jgi:hypothetical protein
MWGGRKGEMCGTTGASANLLAFPFLLPLPSPPFPSLLPLSSPPYARTCSSSSRTLAAAAPPSPSPPPPSPPLARLAAAAAASACSARRRSSSRSDCACAAAAGGVNSPSRSEPGPATLSVSWIQRPVCFQREGTILSRRHWGSSPAATAPARARERERESLSLPPAATASARRQEVGKLAARWRLRLAGEGGWWWCLGIAVNTMLIQVNIQGTKHLRQRQLALFEPIHQSLCVCVWGGGGVSHFFSAPSETTRKVRVTSRDME